MPRDPVLCADETSTDISVTARHNNTAGLDCSGHKLNTPTLRFLVLFLAILAGYYVLTLSFWVDRCFIYPTLELTAGAASWLMNLAGQGTAVQGVTIQGSDFAVRIQRGCDPLEPVILFAAAVIAFRAPRRKKVLGILLGGLLLFVLNLARILSLCWTTRNHPRWFETVHQEWWPALFIISSLVLWIAWIHWARESRANGYA